MLFIMKTFVLADKMVVSASKEKLIQTNVDWPENVFTNKLPRFHYGTITFCVFHNDGGSITVANVLKKEYNNYIDELKENGFFGKETTLNNLEDGFGCSYAAENMEGWCVNVCYFENGDIHLSIRVS